MLRKKRTYLIIIISVLISGCDYQYVEDEQFVGKWELKGRSSFTGMQIEIQKEEGVLKGKILKLPESEIVNMFAKEGDIWVKNIKRTSNYSFKLSETRIASELFSMYDLNTSTVFKAEFINENKIGLAERNGDPQNSNIYYERIK